MRVWRKHESFPNVLRKDQGASRGDCSTTPKYLGDIGQGSTIDISILTYGKTTNPLIIC